jgi:predicted anti-sigma-YlaC factor YlaD
MGDCGDVRDNGSDFIDGEVNPKLTTRIRHHLGLCNDCNGWMTSLAQTVGLVRQSPQHEVPDSLKDKLRNLSDD